MATNGLSSLNHRINRSNGTNGTNDTLTTSVPACRRQSTASELLMQSMLKVPRNVPHVPQIFPHEVMMSFDSWIRRDGPKIAKVVCTPLHSSRKSQRVESYSMNGYLTLKMFGTDPEDEQLFDAEMSAYERFRAARAVVCDAVPFCHGWIQLDDQTSFWHEYYGHHPPRGFLLEYVHKATALRVDSYALESTNKALRALWSIHEAGVLHNSPEPRNCLVCPASGRIFWVDFHRADSHPDGDFTVGTVLKEQFDVYHRFCEGLKYRFDENVELPDIWGDSLVTGGLRAKMKLLCEQHGDGVFGSA